MLDSLYKVKLQSQTIFLLLCCHYHQIGPPLITLSPVSSNYFSLLVPDINTADVTVLSRNIVLGTNLVGRWQRPDYDNVTHNSISFPIFYQSDGGLYKFYVTGWDGEERLSIQIYLSIMGKYIYIYIAISFNLDNFSVCMCVYYVDPLTKYVKFQNNRRDMFSTAL